MFMKNYKEMADAVFARRDEYVASVKRKKKIALSTSLSLCAICLAVVGAIGIWKMGVVEPDPTVIGTKPPRATHSTTGEPTGITANNTGTGIYETSASDTAKPTEPADSTKPTGTAPQASTGATDPTEKPAKPTKPAASKPGQNTTDATSSIDRYPSSKPTKPGVIAPIVTDPVETNPPTRPYPPTKPVVTEPTEPPEGGVMVPDVVPTKPSYPDCPPCSPMDPTEAPVEPTTASPTTRPSHGDEAPEPEAPDGTAVPDEPVATEPCTVAPTMPSTQGAVVEGRVTDQNGKAVEGVEVRVYSNGMVVASYTTGSNGYFYMSGFRTTSNTYVEVYSVPTGYIKSSQSIDVTSGYNYAGFICPKK